MRKITQILVLVVLAGNASAQVATDACAYAAGNEYNVSENSCQLQSFNVIESYVHDYNPLSCSSGFNKDAFGWFTATSTTTVVRYVPESGRPILHVFTGACNALTQVGCHNSGGEGNTAQVVITTVIGQTYMVRIQNHTVNGPIYGSLCVYNPPANDHCVNSEELMVNDTCNYLTYTSTGATNTSLTPNPSCGSFSSSSAMDIWFHFYAPANGIVEINTTAGTLTDAVMQLYRNSCGSLSLVECNDDSGPGLMPRIDRNCNPLVPNALYTIRLWGKSATTGSFDICVMSKLAYQNPQQDCVGGYTICSSQVITSTTESRGCTQDLNSTNRGCLISNERQGVWYFFSPSAAGTIEFTITPIDANGNTVSVDYDFALWDSGTQVSCPPAAAPIRCSYASAVNSGSNIGAGTYLTGLKNGETDTSEPAFNGVNGFVQPLVIPPAHIGKVFILYVDNFDTNNQRFRLDWTLTGGSSLSCTVLPVELINFEANAESDLVLLSWTTMSENNSDQFIIERSVDGVDFTSIGSTEAAGYSLQRIDYKWADEDPFTGLSYYRLKQMDVDGSWLMSDVVAVNYTALTDVVIYPNPSDGLINVQLEEANSGIQETRIYHISGKLVSTMHHNEKNGGSKNIPVSFLETGTYYIEVIDALGRSRMGRFVKQ